MILLMLQKMRSALCTCGIHLFENKGQAYPQSFIGSINVGCRQECFDLVLLFFFLFINLAAERTNYNNLFFNPFYVLAIFCATKQLLVRPQNSQGMDNFLGRAYINYPAFLSWHSFLHIFFHFLCNIRHSFHGTICFRHIFH